MAPELPDPGEEDLRAEPIHAPMPSDDDSDNENESIYGYQPLPTQDNNLDNDRDDEYITNEDLDEETVTHGDPNLPVVESVDAEIERQVWSEARPQELQIELDNTRTEQILKAMMNFTLPNVAVPEWAAGVPEERWKEELLQRIRQRKVLQTMQGETKEASSGK